MKPNLLILSLAALALMVGAGAALEYLSGLAALSAHEGVQTVLDRIIGAVMVLAIMGALMGGAALFSWCVVEAGRRARNDL